MARKPNHQFEKRKREQLRAERAAARASRKQERAAANASHRRDGSEDPDLAGIVVGPQQRDKVSEEEAHRAVERAMNPGGVLPGDQPRAVRSSRVFVGNLDFGTREDNLRDLFTSAGFTVEEAIIVTDRATGQPRGFAFVEVQGLKEAARAVSKLDAIEFHGRALRVSFPDKPQR